MNTINQKHKYFYTDPLAARWMQGNHGMNFCDAEGEYLDIKENGFRGTCSGEEWGKWLRDERSSPYRFYDKAYIHPDSLHILDLRLHDAIVDRENVSEGQIWRIIEAQLYESQGAVDDDMNNNFISIKAAKINLSGYSYDYRIIQRSGIAFMWPECEK